MSQSSFQETILVIWHEKRAIISSLYPKDLPIESIFPFRPSPLKPHNTESLRLVEKNTLLIRKSTSLIGSTVGFIN